ncbi:hypothetical protein B0H11DRAFT_2268521 [Mycena galericulata]|nr:hypothetical protein B0H11DRAFT_2268521 [Mycena galericulata]
MFHGAIQVLCIKLIEISYIDLAEQTLASIASKCRRNVTPDHSSQIRRIWPIIRNCIAYSDRRLVKFARLYIIRVVDSYHRMSVENLEVLVDTDLICAVNQLLLPAGSPLVAAKTYTLLVVP